MEFEGFAKIPRLSRDCIITEKIDGTNAQVVIEYNDQPIMPGCIEVAGWTIRAGSRNRWITSENDNHGFARWVRDNSEQLIAELGLGRHYGEWWGQGVNGRYKGAPKTFSLFNAGRWQPEVLLNTLTVCSVVPILYEGMFDTVLIQDTVNELTEGGSQVWPTAEAEGIIIYHTASATMFKKTLKGDEKPKGMEVS